VQREDNPRSEQQSGNDIEMKEGKKQQGTTQNDTTARKYQRCS
jgi:hypothetical protein